MLTCFFILFHSETFASSSSQPRLRSEKVRLLRSSQLSGQPLTHTLTLAVKKTYSGKVGGRNDDLAISLQLAITGIRTFYQQVYKTGPSMLTCPY